MKTKEIYSIFGGKDNTPTKKVINASTSGRKSEISKETIRIKKERQSFLRSYTTQLQLRLNLLLWVSITMQHVIQWKS